MSSRVVGFLCAVGFAGFGLFAASRLFERPQAKQDPDMVGPLLQQVQALGDLHTVKYTYRDVHEYSSHEEPNLLFAALPGGSDLVHAATSNTALMSYTGTVEAGVDLTRAKVHRLPHSVEIQLPKPQVFPANVTARVHDLHRGGGGHEISIATDAIDDAKLRFRQASIQQGIVAAAEKNARLRVASLAQSVAKVPVTVTFAQS